MKDFTMNHKLKYCLTNDPTNSKVALQQEITALEFKIEALGHKLKNKCINGDLHIDDLPETFHSDSTYFEIIKKIRI